MTRRHKTPILATNHIPSPYARLAPDELSRTMPHLKSSPFNMLREQTVTHGMRHFIEHLGISLVNPRYAVRLAQSLNWLDQSVYGLTRAAYWDFFVQFLLALWPLLAKDIQYRLRPFLQHTLPSDFQLLFACLDPQWTLQSAAESSDDPACLALRVAHAAGQTLTEDDILAIVNPFRTQKTIPSSIITLLRVLSTQSLESLYRQRTTKVFRATALLCPQAPVSAVTRVIREMRFPYQDTEHWVGLPDNSYPHAPIWLAPIRLDALHAHKPDDLLTIGAWAKHPTILSPQMALTPTDSVVAYLTREANGAYADIVTLVSHRLTSLPSTLIVKPIPSSGYLIQRQIRQKTIPIDTLAMLLHAGQHLFDLAIRHTLLDSMSSTTPEAWVRRLSRHTNWTIRRDCLLRCAIPEDMQPILKRDPIGQIALQAMQRYGYTTADLDHFILTKPVSDIQLLAKFIPLPPSHINFLKAHQSVYVRANIAKYQLLSPTLRQAFLNEKHEQVRAAMLQRQDITPDEIHRCCARLTLTIARIAVQNPTTPHEIIARIARLWRSQLRQELLVHPHLSDIARITLAVQ